MYTRRRCKRTYVRTQPHASRGQAHVYRHVFRFVYRRVHRRMFWGLWLRSVGQRGSGGERGSNIFVINNIRVINILCIIAC